MSLLIGLFVAAFLSATLLPGGSEVVFVGLQSQELHPLALLIFIAALGNTLGGMTTWFLGWLAAKRFYPEKPAQQRALAWLRRWGAPILLLSWLPLIGDALCLAAGWVRIKPHWALIYMAIGKTARYTLLALSVRAVI